MNLPDIPNRSFPDHFAGGADEISGMAVVAQLGCNACLSGNFGYQPRLTHIVCKRLFAIGVLALPHGGDADIGVQMVGGGTKDRIDRLLLFQHHPEVLVIGNLVIGGFLGVVLFHHVLDLKAARGAFIVERLQIMELSGVREGDNLSIRQLKQRPGIVQPLTTAPNDCDVHFFAGRHESGSSQNMTGNDGEARSDCGCGLDELPSGHAAGRGSLGRFVRLMGIHVGVVGMEWGYFDGAAHWTALQRIWRTSGRKKSL